MMNRARVRTPILGLALALGLAACSGDPTGPRPIPIEETVFAGFLGIDLSKMTRLETGVYIQDIVVGEGDAAAVGDTLTVHYSLWLPDGRLIQDSRAIGDEPVELVLVGPPQGVIPGWVDGIPGMREGGTRKLVIPYDRAYGPYDVRDRNGTVVIPAYSNLVFEVELVEVKRPAEEEPPAD